MSAMEVDNALEIVKQCLKDCLTREERYNFITTTKHVQAYEPFEIVVKGKVSAMVFTPEGETITWAWTTRIRGRVNLCPEPSAVGELMLYMRLANVLIADPRFTMASNIRELRS